MLKATVSLLMASLAFFVLPQGQEPKVQRPAPPPADAPKLPLVDEPFVSPVPRLDLPMRFQQRDPLEGFWELRMRAVAAQPAAVARGMLAVGRGVMMVHFEGAGTDPKLPLLRAGCYSWQRNPEPDSVRMTVIASHYNDVDGELHAEPKGTQQVRRFQILGDTLRVHQGSGNWLEFVRVE
jgi:hypothetical protein